MATDREITESEVHHLLAERIGDRGIAVIAGELDENEIDIYMTPFQWGPSPPEPESYSATSTGTPAPLSPDVAELVRRVRQVDYAEDAGGYLLKDEVNQLADACERLAAENAKLLHLLERYNAAVANGNDTSLLFAEASAALKETTK